MELTEHNGAEPNGSPPKVTLQQVADTVVRRAQRQGFVVPRDIRAELSLAGLPEDHWQHIVDLARGSLNHRQGRYYHIAALSPRLQEEQNQQRLIQRAIRKVIRHYRDVADRHERREEDRIDYIQPVKVRTDDGREFNLLSRDLSPTGIRILGTKRLLGQKVRVVLPPGEGEEPLVFLVRILWTCSVGDDLFENGGTFVEVVSG
jgi:hypothetical protein